MSEPIVLKSGDPILSSVKFKAYRSMAPRRVVPFVPAEGEPQTMEIDTPWGAHLTVKKGDFLVSELNAPDDVWPVNPEIFDASYLITGPGLCVKRAITWMAPLTDLTDGDGDRMVTINTLEGLETVRAGDFFLAKGVKDEIWPYPKEKAEEIMKPAD